MTARSEEIKEEADYVNAAVCTVEKTGSTSDQKFPSFTKSLPPLAVCWVTLLIITSLRIYFTFVMSENNTKLIVENQQLKTLMQHLNENKGNKMSLLIINHNLTNLSNKNTSEKLRRDHNNLTLQFSNLTQDSCVLEIKIANVTEENQNLKTQNQQLETQNQELKRQKKDLTDKIQDMETKQNELNVSHAQWSIDAYCPKENDKRRCKPCQDGWEVSQSSCFAILNTPPARRKTWDEAQADCKGKISDLAVIDNQEEKEFISNNSWSSSGTNGYWIGLRVEDGKWKWVDGTDLTETSWIQQHPPTDGHCAISVQNEGWKSVNCGDKKMWICEKAALSV